MSDEIIFYDLPAKDGRAWSLNPWKTRLLLNFKNLPYRTQWTEYPDVAPTLSKLVSPNATGSMAEFTIPAVTLPDGTSIMDSLAIARHIESLHPSPPLHVDDPNVSLIATQLLPKANNALQPIYIPSVPTLLLNPPSSAYFTRTREARLQTTLSALRDDPVLGGPHAFAAARPHIDAIAALYRDGGDGKGAGEGPFLRGKEVSYADFVVVAWLKMFERLGRLDELLGGEGEGRELRGVLEASRGWLERDSY